MKKILICFLCTIGLISCWQNNFIDSSQDASASNGKNQEIRRVGVQTFKDSISTGDYTVLDIRTIQELKYTWVIWEVQNIDFYSSDFIDKLKQLDIDKAYAIYCNSWNRSSKALWIMKELWFKKVIELEWWIQSWIIGDEVTNTY